MLETVVATCSCQTQYHDVRRQGTPANARLAERVATEAGRSMTNHHYDPHT